MEKLSTALFDPDESFGPLSPSYYFSRQVGCTCEQLYIYTCSTVVSNRDSTSYFSPELKVKLDLHSTNDLVVVGKAEELIVKRFKSNQRNSILASVQ